MIFDIYLNGLSDTEMSAIQYEYGIHRHSAYIYWIDFHFLSDLRHFCAKYDLKCYYNPVCACGELYRLPHEKEDIDHQKG